MFRGECRTSINQDLLRVLTERSIAATSLDEKRKERFSEKCHRNYNFECATFLGP